MKTAGRRIWDGALNAKFCAGEEVPLNLRFVQLNANGAQVDQPTTGRVIRFRLLDDSGAEAANLEGAWNQRTDPATAQTYTRLSFSFSGEVTASLLATGQEAARYGGELSEDRDTGRAVIQASTVLVERAGSGGGGGVGSVSTDSEIVLLYGGDQDILVLNDGPPGATGVGTPGAKGDQGDPGSLDGPATAALAAMQAAVAARSTGPLVIASNGVVFAAPVYDSARAMISGPDVDGNTWGIFESKLRKVSPQVDPFVTDYEVVPDLVFPFEGRTGFGMPKSPLVLMFLGIGQSIELTNSVSFEMRAQVIGSITGTVLSVTEVITGGGISEGDLLGGEIDFSGFTAIVQQLTGDPGGVGTYTVSAAATTASEAITISNPSVPTDRIATPEYLDTESYQIGQLSYPGYSPEADNYSDLRRLAANKVNPDGTTSPTSAHQTYGVTLVHYLQEGLKAVPDIGRETRIIYSAAALGGRRIDQIAPGTQVFANAKYLIETALEQARIEWGDDVELEVHFTSCIGPENAKESTPGEAFTHGALDVFAAYRALAQSITDQKRAPFVFIVGTDEFDGSADNLGAHEVADAQVRLPELDPQIRYCGNLYQFINQPGDRIHKSCAAGMPQLGELIGYTVLHTLFYPAVAAQRIRRTWWTAGEAWADLIVEFTNPTSKAVSDTVVTVSTLPSLGIDVTEGPLGEALAIDTITAVEDSPAQFRVAFTADPSTLFAPFFYMGHRRTPGAGDFALYTGPVYGARTGFYETAPIALGVTDGMGGYVSTAVDMDGNPLGQDLHRFTAIESFALPRAPAS